METYPLTYQLPARTEINDVTKIPDDIKDEIKAALQDDPPITIEKEPINDEKKPTNSFNIMQIVACVAFFLFFFIFYLKKSYVVAVISAIAFANYAAINCNIGNTEYSPGVTDYLPRYLDWILTTPLLLLTLLLKIGVKDIGQILFFIFLDVMMIYTGYLASMISDINFKYVMFAISTFFYLIIFLLLYTLKPPLLQFYFLFFAWMAYPILWILHQTDSGISNENYDYSISAVDIFSKIGYGLILHV